MNMLTYEQLIEIDGILHEPLSSQQKQLRELEDLFNSILASQRQAILKEVREGVIGEDNEYGEQYGRKVCWLCYENDYCYHETQDELRAEQRIKLDAMEKKV